ncbi:hypothetical protein S40293_11327 [Stachybotrys chartarum IBT 40293]|nr:hypothetical protein S40293_11327 [Stachybotrys chartarum IBT 40293]
MQGSHHSSAPTSGVAGAAATASESFLYPDIADTSNGYEWIGGLGAAARHGMTALKLDESRLITFISTFWDASYASDATMAALVGLAIKP